MIAAMGRKRQITEGHRQKTTNSTLTYAYTTHVHAYGYTPKAFASRQSDGHQRISLL